MFALTLVKPGKPWPKLRPHAGGPPYSDSFRPLDARPAAGEVFPANCEIAASMGRKDGALIMGTRNTTMPMLAEAIYSYGSMSGEVDRPVVDRTGLNGKFDFTVEYTRGENDRMVRPGPPDADAPPPGAQGSPFLSAVREQLGLRLTPSKAPMRRLIIDHIERPSEN